MLWCMPCRSVITCFIGLIVCSGLPTRNVIWCVWGVKRGSMCAKTASSIHTISHGIKRHVCMVSMVTFVGTLCSNVASFFDTCSTLYMP